MWLRIVATPPATSDQLSVALSAAIEDKSAPVLTVPSEPSIETIPPAVCLLLVELVVCASREDAEIAALLDVDVPAPIPINA
jgi:hypothetical protein